MERLKRILIRLLFLPAGLSAAVAVAGFGLVIYVFATGADATPLAYVSYGASAYALAVVSVNAPRLVRWARGGFRGSVLLEKARSSQRGERFLSDSMYRAEVGLYAGLLVNLLYAAVKLVSGIVFHSVWFASLAGYYLILSLLRFALAHHTRRRGTGRDMMAEWRRYRLCGGVLLIMNQALAVVVFMVVRRSSGFEYPGMLIYAMAAYTFYAVIIAVRNMVRFKRRGSPVMSAAKAVSFVAALVSLLSLETAMLTQFGRADDAAFRRIITGLTGWVVCVIVLGMAIYMIIKSTKQIANLKRGVKDT